MIPRTIVICLVNIFTIWWYSTVLCFKIFMFQNILKNFILLKRNIFIAKDLVAISNNGTYQNLVIISPLISEMENNFINYPSSRYEIKSKESWRIYAFYSTYWQSDFARVIGNFVYCEYRVSGKQKARAFTSREA